MDGYLVRFFTQQNREHQGQSLARWIVGEAKRLGIRGATLVSGAEGFGNDGCFHSENFFGLEDPPLQVIMAMTQEEWDSLIACLEKNKIKIFYTKTKSEFGYTSEKDQTAAGRPQKEIQ